MKPFEDFFENVLWASRLALMIGVLGSVVVAFVALYVATIDVVDLIRQLGSYADLTAPGHELLRAKIVTTILKVIDGYLLATVVFIFALGLYELFISRVAAADALPSLPRPLVIRSLDDLKDRLAKVVMLILVIEFFEHALSVPYKNILDTLYLALGILFIGGALFLTASKSSEK